MADYGQGLMVSRDFRQAYLQELDLMPISGDHDLFNIFISMIDIRADSIIDSKTYSMTYKHFF